MRDVVIVDGMRTAFGRMGGALRPFTPVQLAGMTIKGLCEKTGILEKGTVDAVFAGSASGDVNCHNFARYATLLTATHTHEQLDRAINAIAEVMKLLPPSSKCSVVHPSHVSIMQHCRSRLVSLTWPSAAVQKHTARATINSPPPWNHIRIFLLRQPSPVWLRLMKMICP